METIAFTKVRLPGGWMGNMSPHAVTADGREWRTCEALFQALRFPEGDVRTSIWRAKSPMQAKIIAKGNLDKMVVRRYSQRDVRNMLQVLRLKIEQHPDLGTLLDQTGNALLVEDVTSRMGGSGLFWGAAKFEWGWEGRNWLGGLWMELRDERRGVAGSVIAGDLTALPE